MIRIQERLQARWPGWFRGRRARIAQPLLRTLGDWSRFDDIDGFLAAHAGVRGFDFVDAASRHLGLLWQADPGALARIPAQGRLLVVANHPSGALDALALLSAIGQVRRDVRIIANDVLSAIEGLGDLLLPVRIFGGRPRPESLAAVEAALQAGQCVVVFPAGEVSRLGPRGVRDSRWRGGFLRFARAAAAPVLPVRIEARNSALFYGVSALWKPAATALLAREMYARRVHPLRLRVGAPMPVPAGDDRVVLRAFRRQLYALGTRAEARRPGQVPVARAEPPAAVRAAIAATECLGRSSEGREIRLARGLPADGTLLRELGRLREATFRAVGEGTGRARDIDAFDAHYDHLLLWDAGAGRIVGGYRIAHGAAVLAARGLAGFYSASLFRYADAAIPRLAEGAQLGRSFVVADCQGGRSLDELWQGIGAWLQRHPQVRWLVGPVSISAALPPAARDQLVGYCRRYHGGGEGLAQPRRPFRYFAAPPEFDTADADTAFAVLRANLAALGTAVPTLYRQYADLCEPGGVRFLAFGVDPDFSDAIDGLVEVDLHALHPRKRRRWLERHRDPAAAAGACA